MSMFSKMLDDLKKSARHVNWQTVVDDFVAYLVAKGPIQGSYKGKKGWLYFSDKPPVK